MSTQSANATAANVTIAKAAYQAYVTKDRAALEALLATRGPSISMRWWFLRPVRVRRFRFGHPHSNGLGGRRHRDHCRRPQGTWGGV
jgi:hypothetical protein